MRTIGSGVSSTANSNLVQLNSLTSVGAQDQHSGGFSQGQHSKGAVQGRLRTTGNTQCPPARGAVQSLLTTGNTQCPPAGGAVQSLRATGNAQCPPAVHGQQAAAAVQDQQPGGAAKRPIQG